MNARSAGRGLSRATTMLGLLAVSLLVAALAAAPAWSAQPDPEPGPTPFPTQPTDTPPSPGPGDPLLPEPTPSTTTPQAPPVVGDQLCPAGENPDTWDIPGQVQRAVTGLLCGLVTEALNPVLETLGTSVLATPDLTSNEQIRQIWTANLVIANTLLVLLVIAAGFLVATRESLQTQYGPRELIPRLIVAALSANLSLPLIGIGIELLTAITATIAGQDVDPNAALQALSETLQPGPLGSILGTLLLIAIVVMAIIVLFSFIVRVAVLVCLIIVAPFALLAHALPGTEPLAHVWWRALAGCGAIQFGQTIVLVGGVRVFLTPAGPTILGLPATADGWIRILVALVMLWLLAKIPIWVKEYMWLRSRGVLRQAIYAILLLSALASRGRSGGSGDPQPSDPDDPPPPPPPTPTPTPSPRPTPTLPPAPTRRALPSPHPGGGEPGGTPRRHRLDPRSPRPGPGRRPAPRPIHPSRTSGSQPDLAPRGSSGDHRVGQVSRGRPAPAGEPVRLAGGGFNPPRPAVPPRGPVLGGTPAGARHPVAPQPQPQSQPPAQAQPGRSQPAPRPIPAGQPAPTATRRAGAAAAPAAVPAPTAPLGRPPSRAATATSPPVASAAARTSPPSRPAPSHRADSGGGRR
jgi:hypothetical protein